MLIAVNADMLQVHVECSRLILRRGFAEASCEQVNRTIRSQTLILGQVRISHFTQQVKSSLSDWLRCEKKNRFFFPSFFGLCLYLYASEENIVLLHFFKNVSSTLLSNLKNERWKKNSFNIFPHVDFRLFICTFRMSLKFHAFN